MGVFDSVKATREEHRSSRAGDAIVAEPNVVMDRAFTVPAAPEQVWPWLVQLGKKRAGWYLPASIERLLPPSRRALRRIDLAWQHLAEGDVIPDYGRRSARDVPSRRAGPGPRDRLHVVQGADSTDVVDRAPAD